MLTAIRQAAMHYYALELRNSLFPSKINYIQKTAGPKASLMSRLPLLEYSYKYHS